MDYIKGITFAPFSGAGCFERFETYHSIDRMIEETGCNYVTLIPNGLQDTPQSQSIDYSGPASVTDSELEKMIKYIHARGLSVALKPTVNCKNGTWRAHICFFERDIPCEPKWSVWFDAYTDFILHYAEIAEKFNVEMFIIGCELVQTEHREAQWRKLISDVRGVYHGPLTYNADKYLEDNPPWWDCLDIISSSGYYPIDDWGGQLERISSVVKQYNKPFFFAEAGCRSVKGSENIPNNPSFRGEFDTSVQEAWYRAMFTACSKTDFVKGFMLWCWPQKIYPVNAITSRDGYEFLHKPALDVIREHYRL